MNGFFFYILFGLAVSGIIYGIADPFDKYPETLAQHYVSEFGQNVTVSFGSLTGFFNVFFQNAYAEPFRGPDYIIEQLDDDTYKKTIGLKPFVYNNETDSFVPYIHRDGVTFTAHGTVTLDSDCTFNFYESDFINENSTALFQDKILVKAADVSSPNVWEPIDLINEASCNKSWGASFEQFSTGKLRTDIGMMEYKYILNDGSWKTQLEATNLSNEDTKMFGFDQIIDLNVDTIQFGNREINIDSFDGAVFERDWLERNDARVMVFEGFYFDIDIAWDYLNSVQVIDTGIGSSRIIFDYRTDDVLLPHETLILDPEFGEINSTFYRARDDSSAADTTCLANTLNKNQDAQDLLLRTSGDTSDPNCSVLGYEFPIGSFSSNIDVTVLTVTYDVDIATNARNCDFVQLSTLPSDATATALWNEVTTGIEYVNNDATCTTVANDKTESLGATAITDFENAVSNGDSAFPLGIRYDSMTRDGSQHNTRFSDVTLSVTYNLPPDPPKQFSGSVNPTTGVSTSWSAGETNGDTHNDFTVQRLNLDGITWNDLTTTTSTSYFDNQPQQNDTASYRIWDNGALGRGCSQSLMNSTVIANLTSHYPFCYTMNDSGIQDNDGTVTGNELYDNSTGIVSFDLDGSSYVTLPNESNYDFEITDPLSISFWGKTSVVGNNQRLIMKGVNVAPAFEIFYDTLERIGIQFTDGAGQFLTSRADFGFENGNWHHFVATYDGSVTSGGINIYINGTFQSPVGVSGGSPSTILNNQPLVIGARSDGTDDFTGNMYDVMIIDRELDSNEVAQLYGEYIDTSTLAMKPNAVTDLAATTPPDLSTVNLAWSEPFVFGGTDGYMINFTTPFGDPLTIRTNNTESTDTSAAILGLQIGVDYSFRVSPWNDFGTNGSGNIVNATTETSYEIGNLTSPDVTNTDDFQIFYERNDINSTALFLNVTYPNSYTLECNMYYQFARTNNTYSGLSSTAVDADNVESSFLFINATGDIVNVKCYDTVTGDEAKYVLTITQFPFLDHIANMRDGTYGTYFEIGAIDGITLMVVFLAMIGFNRTTPIAGIVFLAITILALVFFDIITYPVIMYPALALLMVWGFMATRKDD